jgi:hypothetical protein
MVAEATSQNREPDFGLSAAIHRRQVWRPAGLRGVKSILSNIANRNRRFDSHRARLTAWYEQFVQRSQPFIGWEPLTTVKFDAPDIESSFGSTPTQERVSPRESPMISKELPPFMRPVRVAQDQPSTTHLHRLPVEEQRQQHPSILRRSISGPVHTAARSLPPGDPVAEELSGSHEPARETSSQPVAPTAQEETAGYPAVPTRSPELRQPAAKDVRSPTEPWSASSLAAPTQRREEQSLERPALRLAILRPINTVAGTVQRKESGPLSSAASGFSMAETNDLRPEHSLVEGLSAFQPRLVSRASSLQRQEVRGGFPAPMAAEARDDTDTSSDDPRGGSGRETSAFRDDRAMESRSLAPSRQAEVPEPAAIPSMVLPGVQIRLLKPDESASTTPPSSRNVAEAGRSAIDISKPQPPVPAAPPPLDINAVAEKVYQTLQRRLQFERERRGLY